MELIEGIFIEELKNRFLCKVRVDGIDELCYVPASCKLSNFLELEKKRVLLEPTGGTANRTRYALWAVKNKRRYVFVNLSKVNDVVANSLGRKIFSPLGKRKNVLREHTVDGYRADIFIPDTYTVIEIKSVICTAEEAVFPSVYSERSIKQLRHILDLLGKGYKVQYYIISLFPSTERIVINKEEEIFYALFIECLRNGMGCSAFSLQIVNNNPVIKRRIEIK